MIKDLSDAGGQSNKQEHRDPPEEIREAKPKTKSLELLIYGPSKKYRQSFGEGHLGFVIVKTGEIRNMRIWDIQGWPEQLWRTYRGMFRGRALGRNNARAGREGYKRADLA